MKCETCSIRDFVHAGLYCLGCENKPKPRIKTGRAYLFVKSSDRPVYSVEIEAPKGTEYGVSAAKLMQQFRIEFIEDGRELAETILEGMR